MIIPKHKLLPNSAWDSATLEPIRMVREDIDNDLREYPKQIVQTIHASCMQD